MKSYINKISLKGLQAFQNKALILNIHGGIFHFNQIWGIVLKSNRTHIHVFSCGVTFSRRTEKGVNTVVLALCFSGYFMSILSSSWYRNIHVSVYTHTRIHTYIQNLFIYLYIYTHTCICVWQSVSSLAMSKAATRGAGISLSWGKWSAKATQRWPLPMWSSSEKKGRSPPRPGGHRPAQGRPPPPRSAAREAGGPWGTPGGLRGAGATPTSRSPQEFLALSLHPCHLLIPAALAQMGGNPTLEEIKEPEIAAFRITERKWRNLIHSHPLRYWVSIRPYTTF